MVDAGGTAELVAPKSGMVETMRHLDRADRFPVDQLTERASAADYDAVVLPGGVANPDHLRTDAAGGGLPHGDVRGGQAGGGHLPRAVDPH